ncbi:molybdopterin oxidoreductase [Nocardia sp. NPDC003482]|uniref:molybdopterin oxidoreductase n=1 Tax=Nocardia sp. NPDC004068 TaxID=3364303 RepID=UPI0036948691
MNDGSTPRFLQGVFDFRGKGFADPITLDDALRYVVPPGATVQPVYFRGGNSTDEMITVGLYRDGALMRYFPIAAKGSLHVSLRVVEELLGDTVLELRLLAPLDAAGTVVIDLGMIEI